MGASGINEHSDNDIKTCKNCLSYNICARHELEKARLLGEDGKKYILIKECVACRDFKDKNLIIELPCKEGDTVYVVIQETGFSVMWRVAEGKVCGFYQGIYGFEIRVDCGFALGSFYVPNERLFLTKAEAEQKLKELSKK